MSIRPGGEAAVAYRISTVTLAASGLVRVAHGLLSL